MSKVYEALMKAGNGGNGLASNQAKPLSVPPRLFKNGRQAPKINFDPEPYLAEQYHRVRRHLLLGPMHSGMKVIMVAATYHGEGGTTTAATLASTLARSKNFKTLLIDANLRTPALDDVFVGQQNPIGLSDVVLSEANLDQSIYQTRYSNLFVLPSGKAVSSPSYIFDGNSLSSLLDRLRERFEYIIFDASPLDAYSESSFLASKVDGVILVVEAERTKTEVVRRIKKGLEATGATIIGVVLNKKRKYIPEFLERFFL
jgi:capsular exopolysaccharide synthesis family protein